MSAVYILWLRQLKRYFRSKSRIVGALGQPLLFLFALGFGFGPIYKQAGQGDYIQFLVPGIMAMTILFTSMFTGIEIIWDRQFGFLKETLVAPVSRFHIMLGRSLGGATIAIFQGLVVFSISFFAGFKVENWLMAPVAIVFMFLTAMLFTALGTAIASFLEDMQGFQLIMNFLIMPTFFLSGALFPLNGLPDVLTYITMFNPLSYGVDALRGALTGTTHFGFLVDFAALGIGGTILLFIGGYLFSKVQI
ncbi:MAG: ABC transporter permease [Candidatus Aquicultor sp.]|nr:ABC transporter permease [Candidatus Aquicultor sp.]